MAGVVLPNGRNYFATSTGAPLVGGKVYTYIPGTSTPKNTYTTSVANVANANPVILDSRGEAAIYWVGDYDVVLNDASDVTIWGPERLNQPEVAGTASTLQTDLANTASDTKGAAMVGYARSRSYAAGTVGKKLKERISVFDFMSSAEIADVLAGTRSLNVTTSVQAAIDFASAITDRQTELEFIAGDYAVTTLDFSACKHVTFIFRGSVIITGVTAATTYLVKMAGTGSSDAPRGNQFVGTLYIQSTQTSYASGFYGRWIIDSSLNLSISGSFTVACCDLDVCFNNDWPWLSVAPAAVNKPGIVFGSNNMNVNRMRIRVAGTGSGNGQTGLSLNGLNNSIFGDISAVANALDLVAARGCTVQIYTEDVGKSVICSSGTSHAVSLIGCHFAVASSTTGVDLTGGGSVLGLALIGCRFFGFAGGTARQSINWGAAAYGVTYLSCSNTNIDTEMTGTFRGTTGGANTALTGAIRHYGTGAFQALGGRADTVTGINMTGAGTYTPDADAGSSVLVNITSTAAFTLANPSGTPLTGHKLKVTFKNASGGAVGAVTFGSKYKHDTLTMPANGKSLSITYEYDAANWIEESRTSNAVPN